MGQSNWEADKMLDIYIHNYLLKRNLQATAKSFMSEAKVSMDPVAIDVPRGFLFEWWSVFWDIFIARTNDKHSEAASSYIEAQQMKVKEQQHQRQLQMQQYQLMPQRQYQLQQSGCLNNSIALDSGASTQLLDARMGLLKSTTNLPGKLGQGNLGNLSVALQGQSHQTSEIKGDLGDSHRSIPLDPSTLYGQEIMQAKSGIVGMSNGLGQGVNNLPMKGWPLPGIDQVSRNFGAQAQRSLSANQFPLLSPQHQALTHVQLQGNLGNPSIGSPMQSDSPRLTRQDQEHLAKIQQSSTQKWLDQFQQQQQQQQLQQNSRKRKQPTSSGPTNSTGTGNTVGPLTSPPSTPTHATGDGVAMAGDFPHARSNSKIMEICGPDEVGRRASSSNHLDELEHFGDIASLDKNEESYLSLDDGGTTELFATLKRGPTEQSMKSSKGFTFSEAAFIRANDSKVVCCDFSSDGKFLASAGHEKKVVLWNMDTLETWRSKEEHSSIITDLCFRPETTQLATSSFDATVQLWDATAPIYKLHTYTGHNSHVIALDFHPKKTDLFCSCDVNGETRFWSSNPPYECSHVSKDALDGKLQVRFQPRVGQFLALASNTVVSILDVETDKKITTIPGHNNELHSICWHANGDNLAVVSQDSVKVWSLASGKCIHELTSKGNNFRSSVFHSSYSNLLIVGGYQTLQLWNMAENQTMAVQAHTDLIAGLAYSSRGVLASVSHDNYVKIWK